MIPKILITGASGNIGSTLIKTLRAQGIPFRAMVRSLNTDIPEAIQGDFNDPVSISNALQGIEKAFLLTNSSEQSENQQITFIELSKALNRQITFIDVPPAAMRDALSQVHFPEWQADGLIEDYAHYAKEERIRSKRSNRQAPTQFRRFCQRLCTRFRIKI